MSDLPRVVSESALWKRLALNSDLEHAMKSLRIRVELLAAKIDQLHPGLTDHSIIHLDALWGVAGHILSQEEIDLVSAGEAFVLGSAFYLHDIGMAIGATSSGCTNLQESENFKGELNKLLASGVGADEAKIRALRYAARSDHAKYAVSLAQGRIPGTDQFLIDNSLIRDNWSESIGQVAASHHWSINELKRTLGEREVVPDATGKENDLVYVACLLRLIDYSHINKDRASILDMHLRPHLPIENIVHWDAQKNIVGPLRKNNLLIYSVTKPIESVNGWWTFYEMARGLDMEIAAVREYLAERAASQGRFSLEGVKGVKFPKDFSKIVRTSGFEPIDIRFRPDSMERLVELLGGKMLYGHDVYAPIRELLQNARDAIELYRAQAAVTEDLEPPRIRINIVDDDQGRYLEVHDNGIGMTEHVVTNYLLGIASDYWHSSDFFTEHGKGLRRKFSPVGRFGIGFLSVFMMGDSVEVKTQRRGGSMLVLNLHGIGQRGTLRKVEGYSPGTTIRVRIPVSDAEKYAGLVDIVRSKAPMLQVPITVAELGMTSEIEPGWWKTIDQGELIEFINGGAEMRHRSKNFKTATGIVSTEYLEHMAWRQYQRDRMNKDPQEQWIGNAPEVVADKARIVAMPENNQVLVCSKGFLVSSNHTAGMLGLIDVEELELTAARSEIFGWDDKAFWEEWSVKLEAHLIHALNCIDCERDIPARYPFLARIGKTYGHKLLMECDLRWLTVKQAPGETKLLTPKLLVNSLLVENEVMICYGASVWLGESKARKILGCAETAPVVLVSSVGQPSVGSYEDKERIVDGDLGEHFKADPYSNGGSNGAVLLNATIGLVAKAWGCSPDSLTCVWKRKDRELFGILKRRESKGAASQ